MGLKNTNRFFIVMYVANHTYKGRCTGETTFTVSESGYINREMLVEQIIENNKTLKEVVITNIIELSETDYNRWIEPIYHGKQ